MQRQSARKIRETSGPTVLTLGAVADGEALVRDGDEIVGAAGLPASGAAGGDLTGSYPNPSVVTASTTVAGKVELATSAETTAGLAVQASDTRLSDSRAPSGAAGGDLSGTYPSPTVTQARGLRETAGPTTLAMGAVADQEILYRDSNTVKGSGIAPPKEVRFDDNGGSWQTWTKPVGHTHCRITLVGGGGGGGAGQAAAEGNPRRGGGGGAAGTETVWVGEIPASTLFAYVARGGAGSATSSGGSGEISTVSITTGSTSAIDLVVRSQATGSFSAGGLPGDVGSGAGGTAGSVWNGSGRYSALGTFTSVAGSAGAAGGNGAAGTAITPDTTRTRTGGGGGGGRSSGNTDFAGGGVSASAPMASVSGGTTGAGTGGNGVATSNPFTGTGGGGGGAGSGTGGTGGNGALGCGGGGGGAGTARGVGGNGGAGWIKILSW